MTAPYLTGTLAALGVSVALAGCGGDDNKAAGPAQSPAGTQTSARTATTTVPVATAPRTTATARAPRHSSGAPPARQNPLGPQARRTVASCRRASGAAMQLSRATRAKLAALCRRAASGDRRAVNAAAREACLAVVKDLRLTGKTAAQARRSCTGAGD